MIKEEVIYTAESDIKNPRKLFKSMFTDLLASRELAYTLLKRDIRGQYRQSVLGFIWAFIPPIVTATTFSLASAFKVLNIGATNIPYPAYIVFSTALWQTFVESVNAPIGAVGGSLGLFTRIKMPKEAPVLAKMGDIYFNFAIKLVLIIAVFLIYRLPVSPLAILAPLALVCMITFGFAIGLLLAPVASLFGDIGRAVSAILGIGMFLTPVVYPAPKGGGLFAAIIKANPVTHLLVGIRELTLFGRIPNFGLFILISIIGFVLLFLAWILYRLAIPYIVERRS
jgi:lipopolysaccharide transport system permease protein